MLLSSILGLALYLCSVLSFAGSLSERKPGPIALEIERAEKPHTALSRKSWSKRTSVASDTLQNGDYLYYANVELGTPAQNVKLWVACLAADTWVNTYSDQCVANPSPCAGAMYSPNTSSTYQYIKSNASFDDGYELGSTVQNVTGDWVSDNIKIGGVGVSGLQFGVAYNTSVTPGTLGLGYIGQEEGASDYPNLLYQMQNQGLIETVAFSLFLGRQNASTGRLLLGGVDTNKFFGALTTIPVLIDSTVYDFAEINVTTITMSNSAHTVTLTTGQQLIMAVDSGTAGVWVPPYISEPVFQAFGVTQDSYGDNIVNTSRVDNTTTFEFTISSMQIKIPISEFLIPLNDTFSYFGMYASGDSVYGTLGIVFMRSVYVVFDYSHNQISIALANYDGGADNVTAISQNGVLGMNLMGASTSTASASPTRTHTPTHTSTGSSSSSSSSATAHPSSGGLSTGAKIGIGVGVGLGSLALIIAAAAFFLFGRKRKQKNQSPATGNRNSKMDVSSMGTSEQYPHSPSAVDGDGEYPEMSYRLTGPHYSADPAFMRHEMDAT